MTSLVSSITWVPKGASAQHPKQYELDDAELARVEELAGVELADARAELQAAAAQAALQNGQGEGEVIDEESSDQAADEDSSVAEIEMSTVENGESNELAQARRAATRIKNEAKPSRDSLDIYKLEEYDDEIQGVNKEQLGLFTSIRGLQYHRNNQDDPYITMKDKDDLSDDDRVELEVRTENNMMIVSKTEDEISQLEMYIFDKTNQDFYIHHDLMLPSFPLCTEWLDFRPRDNHSSDSTTNGLSEGRRGNFVAVGTFEPEIEIWDLDIIDGMYPAIILGRSHKPQETTPAKGKKGSKVLRKRAKNSDHHVDAIMSISWNRLQRNLIATSSADKTVKVWDLSLNDHSKCAISLNMHSDKVQSVKWNPREPTVLLSGSYDRTVQVVDVRAPDASAARFRVESDVEKVQWDPHNPSGFYVSPPLKMGRDQRSI